MKNIVKVKKITPVTHDVLHLVLDKPEDLDFVPGQAIDIAINKPTWDKKKNCFTFVSLPDDNQVEFIIKTYPDRHGVTNELLSVKPGDEIILYKPFGSIRFFGDGVFIAGGAGITPFLAIFKDLERHHKLAGNTLIFANKTKDDIILEDDLRSMLGGNFINVLSDEKNENYEHGYVDADIIRNSTDNLAVYFYLCGPPKMMEAVEKSLAEIGVDSSKIIKEEF